MNFLNVLLDFLLNALLPFVVMIALPVRLVLLFLARNPLVRTLCVGLGLVWVYFAWRIATEGWLPGPEFSRSSTIHPQLWMLVGAGWIVAEAIQRWRTPVTASVDTEDPAAPVRPDWAAWMWGLVFGVTLLIATSFGTTPKNRNDSALLWVVLVLEAVVATVLARLAVSLLRFRPWGWWLGRLLAVIALAVVLFGLGFCSAFTRSGWRGG